MQIDMKNKNQIIERLTNVMCKYNMYMWDGCAYLPFDYIDKGGICMTVSLPTIYDERHKLNHAVYLYTLDLDSFGDAVTRYHTGISIFHKDIDKIICDFIKSQIAAGKKLEKELLMKEILNEG